MIWANSFFCDGKNPATIRSFQIKSKLKAKFHHVAYHELVVLDQPMLLLVSFLTICLNFNLKNVY